VVRTGSHRRPCGFQPGASNSDPCGIIRLNRIRAAHRGADARRRPG
jgi:hypothetical protein